MTAILAIVLACGVERAAVKNLTDKPALLPPIQSTVEDLSLLDKPAKWTPSLARLPAERQVYVLDAEVVGFKLEEDGDYHVVIRHAQNVGVEPAAVKKLTMIVEMPDPSCAPAEHRATFAAVRAAFLRRFQEPTSTYVTLKIPVKVRLNGVAHFDKLHRQTGVAPNGIELHPVLAIEAIP